MKRNLILIAGGLAVALLASTAAFALAQPASAAMRNFVVTVSEAEATLTPADFFTGSLAPNAQASEDAPVYRDGKKVGSAQTLITITRHAGDDIAAIIECSVELPEGNLFFNGSVHVADLGAGADLPVVGGTGAYERFTGAVTLVASEDGSQTTLTFRLRRP